MVYSSLFKCSVISAIYLNKFLQAAQCSSLCRAVTTISVGVCGIENIAVHALIRPPPSVRLHQYHRPQQQQQQQPQRAAVSLNSRRGQSTRVSFEALRRRVAQLTVGDVFGLRRVDLLVGGGGGVVTAAA